MGFFKDFKQDFAQAVSELMPDDVKAQEQKKEEVVVEPEEEGLTTEDSSEEDYEIDLEDMNEILDSLSKGLSDDGETDDTYDIDDLVENSDENLDEDLQYDIENLTGEEEEVIVDEVDDIYETKPNNNQDLDIEDHEIIDVEQEASVNLLDIVEEIIDEPIQTENDEIIEDEAIEDETMDDETMDDETMGETVEQSLDNINTDGEGEENMEENIDLELIDALIAEDDTEAEKEQEETSKVSMRERNVEMSETCTVITKGTVINGSITSDGSLEIMGEVTGDIECLGKLSITGRVIGNSIASEIFVNTDRLDGNISSEGSVKIGLGTVLVGDVTACSGVIAGAVKGEVDVNGPVVIDSTAIIKGNIKAKSIQINNGAVVEGFCSLSYSSIDVDNIFGTDKK